ncbi:ubiquitin carboxyl-terminal hydrolase 20-like [Cynara cardunculus var. scolymus]|uniref:ubiquitin carboxyl-terminal hydrolase 20-like n=1 Tax=Cynara cardunculus var. scolymus TaxID=59895 RepID=UPI000D62E02F|nr:ubiquitin carboxyl-terminal hydrolase 20-like [Cynara cardunculus var. scolymus]
MADSVHHPLSQSPSFFKSFSCPKDSLSPTQTLDLDPHLSSRRSKLHDHARSRMLFDEIAQQQEENMENSNSLESQYQKDDDLLMSNEVLEDSDQPLLSPSGAEPNTLSEPLSPLALDDSANNLVDETDAWISYNRSQTEVYKPFPSVASSSSSWYEEAYEKPCMVGAGLANLGNTCFFNAVLQCFTHSVLLVQGLYSYTHPTPCDCSNERFCLICALREHIENSLSSTGKIVSPWKFVDNLSYFSSSFQRYQQEDAHEFLQCFLDRLESSLNNLKVKDDAVSLQSDNLVKQVFGGCVVSKLRCCNCNYISDTYEPSVDLSLEIEDAISLSTALESFTKVEHIEDEEMRFTCDQCKEKVSVEKQLMLDQTPPICAFHLKRFKNDGSYVEKIDKHVEFPLELDLQPYTCGRQSNNEDLKYELNAVVVHAAFTSSCGHYYCYIRSAPDTWYKFDDSKVTSVSEACVLSEEAYILFYARQGTTWFSNFMETYKPSLDPNLSNTSPKSVLENVDHTSTSADAVHSHEINESCSNKVAAPGVKDRSFQSGTMVPSKSSNFSDLNASNPHVLKEKSPLTLKEYGSNHMPEVEKNTGVTPSRHNRLQGAADSEDDPNRAFSTPFVRPSDGKTTTFDISQVVSPSTPPRSPGLDSSDDENSEVVFAPKADQLKLVEKPSYKRQRSKDVEDSVKHEALRQCKRMPSARGNLLMAALEMGPKSENSVNKRSKKIASPPRKKYSRSSEGFRHDDKSISRNLATSSFR